MRELLTWYRAHGRSLPWRGTRDPWAIWVSEVMLQQTRVETVGPYWERFLRRFPTPTALAEADEQEVLRHWAGLGYYRRARHLHAAARDVVARFGGEVPPTSQEFRSLKGVGRYTAGAVMSIAFDLPEPILDGNVIRVLSRLFRITGDPRSVENQRRLWALAEEVLPDEAAGDFNQALMDLGATICTPTSPNCDACPVSARCEARAAGVVESLPERTKRAPVKAVRAVCAVLTGADGRWLLARRPDDGLLAGLWEFPGTDLVPGERRPPALRRALSERLGLDLTSARLRELGAVTHLFTHRRLSLTAFSCEGWSGVPGALGYPEVKWVAPVDAASLPLPRLTLKVIGVLAEAGARA